MKIHQAVNLSQFPARLSSCPKSGTAPAASRIAYRASKRKPHCVGGDSNRPKRRDAPSSARRECVRTRKSGRPHRTAAFMRACYAAIRAAARTVRPPIAVERAGGAPGEPAYFPAAGSSGFPSWSTSSTSTYSAAISSGAPIGTFAVWGASMSALNVVASSPSTGIMM